MNRELVDRQNTEGLHTRREVRGSTSGLWSTQGTVLGSTLFLIFIDDLEEEIKRRKLEVKVVKFADDTKGGKIIMGTEDRDKIQMALDCQCDWPEKLSMSFNLAKCKIMHISPHNPCYEYFMRGIKLGTMDEERDIRVTITENLKPSAHCSKQRVGRWWF
jgi:hypothetical protein